MKTYGWLIYNGGLNAPKYKVLHQLYLDAAKQLDIQLEALPNHHIYSHLNSRGASITMPSSTSPDFVLFLDKDIRLARQLENKGYKLFNSSSVIETCDDKIATFQALAGKGIALPETIFAPMFFPLQGEDTLLAEMVPYIEQTLGYPLVVKEAFGSFGAQVYLAHNRDELLSLQKKLTYTPHLYQEFIKSSEGRDVRLYVVGNQVVASMERYSKTDFRANVSNGGEMMPYTPPQAFCELAIEATRLLGADFTGVDLLFGKDGLPILCEVNSNAHIKNILDCTGINVAEAIFHYILKEIHHD